MLPKIEEIVEQLKRERTEALLRNYDYQAIGLRKAIDVLQDLLIEESRREEEDA